MLKKRISIVFCMLLGILFLTGAEHRAINESNAPQKCPILLYHHLTDHIPADFETTTSVKKFDSDMKRILEAGYQPISLAEMYDYLLRGIALPEKSVVITFDDGYESNYTLAFPVLEKYGVKADIFLNNDLVGVSSDHGIPHFSWDQAREMEESGLVTVYSHGYTHHDFTSISLDQLKEEYISSKEEIELELGPRKYNMVAYVGGEFNSLTFETLKQAGADVQLLVSYQMDYNSIWEYSFFSRMTVYYTSDVVEMLNEYRAN